MIQVCSPLGRPRMSAPPIVFVLFVPSMHTLEHDSLSKINLSYAFECRALCGANLVTQAMCIRGNATLHLRRGQVLKHR